MRKAFVETTVLTDFLLKGKSDRGILAARALATFDETLLPVYSIKEFQFGPLKNFTWFHNKLAATQSFARSLQALQGMSMTPRRYLVSTALEALQGAASAFSANQNLSSLVQKYGAKAKLDSILCDSFQTSLKANIIRAWRKRRLVTTSIVQPLPCFTETEPKEVSGQLVLPAQQCAPEQECCLAANLRSRSGELQELRKTIQGQDQKAENVKRGQVLRSLYRTPKRLLTPEMCRHLGDAYFALFAPGDSVILSTNLKDLAPLAECLGKTVERPGSEQR